MKMTWSGGSLHGSGADGVLGVLLDHDVDVAVADVALLPVESVLWH